MLQSEITISSFSLRSIAIFMAFYIFHLLAHVGIVIEDMECLHGNGIGLTEEIEVCVTRFHVK